MCVFEVVSMSMMLIDVAFLHAREIMRVCECVCKYIRAHRVHTHIYIYIRVCVCMFPISTAFEGTVSVGLLGGMISRVLTSLTLKSSTKRTWTHATVQ